MLLDGHVGIHTTYDPKKDQIVTLGVYAKTQLVKYGKLNVKTLAEIAAACL